MIALQQTIPTFQRRPSFAQAVIDVLGDWQERYRQRRALLALSQETLKDIGIEPADAWYEGTKPFWKA